MDAPPSEGNPPWLGDPLQYNKELRYFSTRHALHVSKFDRSRRGRVRTNFGDFRWHGARSESQCLLAGV